LLAGREKGFASTEGAIKPLKSIDNAEIMDCGARLEEAKPCTSDLSLSLPRTQGFGHLDNQNPAQGRGGLYQDFWESNFFKAL
jgi:hypothetical protein